MTPAEQLDLFSAAQGLLNLGVLQLLSPDEIFRHASGELLAALGEDSRLERKPAGIQLRDLGDYFVMWANTAPEGGLIVVGQENDGLFSGCIAANRTNDLMKCGSTYAPLAEYDTRRIPVRNLKGANDFVLLFRVRFNTSRLVLNSKGEAFIRSGDEKKKLSSDEIRQLEADHGQVQYELEPTPYKFPQDFDIDLVKQFCDVWLTERELPLTRLAPDEILELSNLGIRREDTFTPNVACSVLLRNTPSITSLEARFDFSGSKERLRELAPVST